MDQASLLRFLQDQGMGPESDLWEPNRPQLQPMLPQGGTGVDIARALQAALAQMQPPRGREGAGSALLRGAATGFSAATLGREGAKQTENEARKQANEKAEAAYTIGAREMRRRRADLEAEKRKALLNPPVESVLDKVFTKDEAMRLKRPELEGVTRRDAGFFNDESARGVGVTPSKKFDYMNTLRDNMRVDPDIKDFGTVRDNYRRVDRMSAMGQGVGDLAIIFSYMKVLDPTSVVRETEFKNAADAVGKLQQLINLPSGIVRGTRLTPEGRQWFRTASWELFKAKQMDYAAAVRSYRDEAAAQGVDASSVLKRYEKYLNDEFMGGDPKAKPDLSKYVGGE